MLAETCDDLNAIEFPVLCTPKLDGIRCLKQGGQALTRSFKPIRNTFAREWLEANVPDGCDGELLLRGKSFSESAGALGRESGQPDFVFNVFDYTASGDLNRGYSRRMDGLMHLKLDENRCRKVLPYLCGNLAELLAYEKEMLAQGYEGVMMRKPSGPYKCGRSTVREGYLLKLKRFADSEATILDTYEGESNLNEAQKDAFGRTKRSTAQAGKVGRNELGGFKVRDRKSGVEFSVGFNHTKSSEGAAALWQHRASLVGMVLKYKYQPSGMLVAPRFPQFLGFRDAWDMDNAA